MKSPDQKRLARYFRHNAVHRRAGAILIWFALLLPLLLGMTGLVIDGGLMMSMQRHLQNSVDAAALAGAVDLYNELTVAEAIGTAQTFVTSHYNLADAQVDVSSPPKTGAYADENGFVEVVASYETPTIFMHLLDGQHNARKASARAVAGAELNESINGIIALDPREVIGLQVSGDAQLSTTGRIIVNSEANGEGRTYAASVTVAALAKAQEFHVVGELLGSERFQNIEPGGPSPVKTGQLPINDPLAYLATPTIANGVIDVDRGAPVITKESVELNNGSDDSSSANYVETDAAGERTTYLNPGIYSSMDISGGRVHFRPGIYVIAGDREASYNMKITGGQIEADGVMFYNTWDEYDPMTGLPDADDGSFAPETGSEDKGRVRINVELGFSGIDSTQYAYPDAAAGISQFDGMLIYQRRRSIAKLELIGFASDRTISGAVYAKWAHLQLTAGGTMNSHLVVGRLSVPAHGDVFIKHEAGDVLQTLDVFLVE